MRWITFALLGLIALVQANLWFSRNGIFHVRGLRGELQQAHEANEQARLRNERMQAEVRDLREGLEMIEEKARSELGMVKRDEIYIQIAPRR